MERGYVITSEQFIPVADFSDLENITDAVKRANEAVRAAEALPDCVNVSKIAVGIAQHGLSPERGSYEIFTSRERDLLALLALGLSNKAIARRCGNSEATVKVMLKQVFRKLGVRNRTQAALWAQQNPHDAAVVIPMKQEDAA